MLKIFVILAALLGSPLFVVISALALISFSSVDINLSVVIIEMSRLADTPLLLSLPLFIFAGTMLAESNTSKRLLNLTHALLGWMPGGLAVISLIVCAVFTAFTGASGVTIFAVGGLLLPALTQDNYSEKFSLGLLTSSGSLGLLFPPSLPLILYGVVAEVRVDHLFLAGILPGLLMLVLLGGYCMVAGRETRPKRGKQPTGTVGKALRGAAWELPLPVIVLGGIYGGIFVAGEAAAVTALYVLIAEICIYRDISLRQLPSIMVKSMVLFGGILVVLAASMATTNFLVDQQVPMRLFEPDPPLHLQQVHLSPPAQHLSAHRRLHARHLFRSGAGGTADRPHCQEYTVSISSIWGSSFSPTCRSATARRRWDSISFWPATASKNRWSNSMSPPCPSWPCCC